MLYPGTGLLEGVNICEARGTSSPFTMCGAPWMDEVKLAAAIQALSLPGVQASPASYTPSAGIFAGTQCHGVQWQVTDIASFNAVQTGIAFLQTVHQLYPQQLQQRLYKTVANPSGEGHLDKLLGVHHAFEKLQQKIPFNTDVQEQWSADICRYLLY